MISTSGGSEERVSKACRTFSVTSTVLASGSFITAIPILGLPFVKDCEPLSSELNRRSATLDSKIGFPLEEKPRFGWRAEPASGASNPTTRLRIWSKEEYSFVVLMGKDLPCSDIDPAGKDILLAAKAFEI